MSNDPMVRVSIEVRRSFRNNLKAALSDQSSDMSQHFRETGQKVIDRYRDKLKKELASASQ